MSRQSYYHTSGLDLDQLRGCNIHGSAFFPLSLQLQAAFLTLTQGNDTSQAMDNVVCRKAMLRHSVDLSCLSTD